jgi:ABC-type taurine transport system ATPase subunit
MLLDALDCMSGEDALLKTRIRNLRIRAPERSSDMVVNLQGDVMESYMLHFKRIVLESFPPTRRTSEIQGVSANEPALAQDAAEEARREYLEDTQFTEKELRVLESLFRNEF